MARPHTPRLSKQRIADAALALIDSTGLAELSMRKLAAELGVRAASLYSHYPTKEQLLHAIADQIVSTVDTSAFENAGERADWAKALKAWARTYRAALAAHPNLVPYLATGPGRREHGLRTADAVHGGLVRAGWPPRHATMIGAATKYLVLGSAMASFSAGFSTDAQLYFDRYPNLKQAHLLPAKAEEIDNDSFELALTAFVDGLRTQFAAIESRRQHRRRAD
ncbi:MAG: TetR family transcriptional regulator [Sciscionella sp.]|nr:TetR family transcriptional regulator [Sciscionella sp.]